MALIGYARVSTAVQGTALQTDALRKAGCERVFEDTVSGVKAERPGLAAALAYVREGDTLAVWRLDRLGRSLPHLIETVGELEGRGVGFRSLTEAIDTTTSGGRLIFHVFGALGQFERDLIRERTKAGLAAAATRGRKGGALLLQNRIRHSSYTGRVHPVHHDQRVAVVCLDELVCQKDPGGRQRMRSILTAGLKYFLWFLLLYGALTAVSLIPQVGAACNAIYRQPTEWLLKGLFPKAYLHLKARPGDADACAAARRRFQRRGGRVRRAAAGWADRHLADGQRRERPCVCLAGTTAEHRQSARLARSWRGAHRRRRYHGAQPAGGAACQRLQCRHRRLRHRPGWRRL